MAVKAGEIEARMNDDARDTFRKWAKGKAAKTVSLALKKVSDLGLKNRNGRIGAAEVKKAIGKK